MRALPPASLAIALTLLAVFPAQAAPRGPSGAVGRAAAVGGIAPAVVASRLQGPDPVDITLLRGRVVVLDFWATWCGPCRTVMPMLERLHRQHHDQGLSVVGISSEPEPHLRAFLGLSPVSYTVGRDTGDTMARYRVRGLPTMVIIDRSGKIRRIVAGAGAAQLREVGTLVSRLLDEAPPQP